MKSPTLTPNTCEGNWLQTDIEELVFSKEDWDSLLNLKMDDRNILLTFTAQKIKFSIKDFFSKCDRIRRNLVTFTEETLNGKHCFCAVFLASMI